MNTLAQAFEEQEARTLNSMKTRKTSANKNLDLFFKAGASRGKDILPAFISAYLENKEYALRLALWLRDIRGGAGERQLFRNILSWMAFAHPEDAKLLMLKIPEVGRWDDLFAVYPTSKELSELAYIMIALGLQHEDTRGLCAKWMPRKGIIAVELRKFLGLTPKQYRKLLVSLTSVVETDMCARNWSKINFEHVPSVASVRYKKAFYRHVPDLFEAYTKKAVKGEAKINASAVYPYDVIKNVNSISNKALIDHINAQWKALPNYFEKGESALAVVDVSGSMLCPVGGNPNLYCIDVAISLGLYCADKNKGPFKDMFVTFSEHPSFEVLKGDVVEKYKQLSNSSWGTSTNLHAVFEELLQIAKKSKVSQKEMPKTILILSDMQFNQCIKFDDSAHEMIKRKYKDSGYILPRVVFWNLNAYDNVPVRFDKNDTALISGLAPSILKAVFGDTKSFSPENVMLDTIMNERYNPYNPYFKKE